MSELVQRIRTKYPGAYDDMDDVSLERAVLAKYPQYSDLASRMTKPEADAEMQRVTQPRTVIKQPERTSIIDRNVRELEAESAAQRFTKDEGAQQADVEFEKATTVMPKRQNRGRGVLSFLPTVRPRSVAEGLVSEQSERRAGAPLAIVPDQTGKELQGAKSEFAQEPMYPEADETLTTNRVQPVAERISLSEPQVPVLSQPKSTIPDHVAVVAGPGGEPTYIPKDDSPEAQEFMQAYREGQVEAAKMVTGWHGYERIAEALKPELRPGESEHPVRGGLKRGAEVVSGMGEAMTPLFILAVGNAAIEAAAGRFVPLVNLGSGLVLGKAAETVSEKGTEFAGAPPEAQELIGEAAFWLPSVFGATRSLGRRVPGVGEMEGVRGPGFAYGEMRTPETTRYQVRVGPVQAGVNLAGQGIQKSSPVAPEIGGQPKVPPTEPPPPAPSAPTTIRPQSIELVTQAIAQAPAESRPQLILEAHDNLAKWMVQQGRVVSPDGKITLIKTPEQAQTLAAKWINDKVKGATKSATSTPSDTAPASTVPEAQAPETQAVSQPERIAQPAEFEVQEQPPVPSATQAEPIPERPVTDRRAEPRGLDRRQNLEQRKRIEEMTPEEKDSEIAQLRHERTTDKLTGLPNRTGFDEAQQNTPSSFVATSDADGLKAVNDNFGHPVGDALLKAKADALREAGLDAYHVSGDEFLYRGESPEALQFGLEKARQILQNKEFSVTAADGSTVTLKGADFSYGTGTTLDEAETGLRTNKERRLATGERVERGQLGRIGRVGQEARGNQGDQIQVQEVVQSPSVTPEQGAGNKSTQPKAETPASAIEQAKRDWRDRRAFWDGQNFRYFQTGEGLIDNEQSRAYIPKKLRGTLVPWNDLAKAEFHGPEALDKASPRASAEEILAELQSRRTSSAKSDRLADFSTSPSTAGIPQLNPKTKAKPSNVPKFLKPKKATTATAQKQPEKSSKLFDRERYASERKKMEAEESPEPSATLQERQSGPNIAAAVKQADTLNIPQGSFRVIRGKKHDYHFLDKFRSPLSTGDLIGAYERIGGPLGRTASDAFQKAKSEIQKQAHAWGKQIDQIDALLKRVGRGENKPRKQVDSEFIALIEKRFDDPNRRSVNADVQRALEFHDNLAENIRQYIIESRRDLNIETSDDWGITAQGYFRHLFLGDIRLFADGEFIGTAPTYVLAQKKAIEYLKENPNAKITAKARDTVVGDPTLRVSSRRYFTIANKLAQEVDLSMEEIMGDLRGKIGQTKNKRKFWGALEHRKGYEGYSRDYRAVMELHAYQAARTQEFSKLNRALQPIIENIKKSGLEGLAETMQRHLDTLWGVPTKIEKEFGRLIERIPVLRNYIAQPALAMRGLAGRITGLQSGLRLKFNIRSALVNRLQPLQTLWMWTGTKEYLALEAEIRKPSVRQMLRDKGVFQGSTKLEGDVMVHGAASKAPFAMASQENRGLGYLFGIRKAQREGITDDDKIHRIGMEWADRVEFDNSQWNAPEFLRHPLGRLFFQFKGFTVKNVENLFDAARRRQGEPRRAPWMRAGKFVGATAAIGGTKALPPFGIGGSVLRLAILGALIAALKQNGMDDEEARTMAEAIYYGTPSLLGQDLSMSVTLLDEPFGNTPEEKIVNFFGGPTVSTGVAISKIGIPKDSDEAWKLATRITPYSKSGRTFLDMVRKGHTSIRVGNRKMQLSPFESVMYGLGFTPLKQSRFYEQRDMRKDMKERTKEGKPALPTFLRNMRSQQQRQGDAQ